MSLAKALPNRPRRKSQEDRPPGFVRSNVLQRMPAQKIGLVRKYFEPARCGYSDQTSAGNNRDNDVGNNNVRRTNSTGDNKVWHNTGTENSNRRDNIRNSPDRTRY